MERVCFNNLVHRALTPRTSDLGTFSYFGSTTLSVARNSITSSPNLLAVENNQTQDL